MNRRIITRDGFARAIVLAVAAAGVALVAWNAAMGGRHAGGAGVPRAAAVTLEAVHSRAWDGDLDTRLDGAGPASRLIQSWTWFQGDDYDVDPDRREASLYLRVNEVALDRIGLSPDTRLGTRPPPGTLRQRLEAVLATADPIGRLACAREGRRVLITTTDDLAAAAEMRAARAGAPPAVRRALDARVDAADFTGLNLGEILKHVSRVYGVPIDADYARLARDDVRTLAYDVAHTDLGALLERVLRQADGFTATPRYRVTGGRIVIDLPPSAPRRPPTDDDDDKQGGRR